MWYAKMYFSGEKEFFENDAFGMQGLPSKQLELPFLESLLTFLELDEKEITPMLERISVNWEHFVESSDLGAHTAAMVELGMLAEKHIYFRLLYTRSFGCFSVNGYDQAEIQAIALALKEFVKQFSETRKQVEKFFECVLDVDSAGREPQKQAAKNYHHDQPRDPELFRFEPIPLSFEPVEPGRCAPVLYSSAVRDMIDYSLRSCVERGVTVRRCKNCGRWFPQTGRVSAEYCERPVKYGEQRCREIGAFRQWTKKQTDDPIFKAYRKEYKKRFAWIKAGRITDEQFYAWSEKAREEKKWRLWKEAEEKQLRSLGVSEKDIEKLRVHDWAIFNSDRRYYQRMQETGTYLEEVAADMTQPEIKTVEDFLDNIENQQLYQVLIKVDRLTLHIAFMKVQGYSTREIASYLRITEKAVYRRLDRLKEKIQKIFE